MKHDWKKHEKDVYGAKPVPALMAVPAQNYSMIDGKGDPNGEDFSNRIAALYSWAYAVKMAYKSAAVHSPVAEGIDDFAVYPLEGIWKGQDDKTLVKENLAYTLMIRQPDFITGDMVAAALEKVKKKKPNPLYGEVRFATGQDGKCVHMLHCGAYDDEPASFEAMLRFARENGLQRAGDWHREIYLNNAGRVEKSRLKTILRFSVQ